LNAELAGTALPHIVTRIPGPNSVHLGERLRAVESPNITAMTPLPPIFWSDARGANVRDADGNIFIDLTAGFGVAHAGHAHPRVITAIQEQAARLPHALGDVYPADMKVRLLERIKTIMPPPLQMTILANSGAEAVEAALKTAVMRTGRPGILAFRDSYHGLTYGALAATHRRHFREPFESQLFRGVEFARFPYEHESCDEALREIDAILEAHDVGAIIVEPIQGRGGIAVPADDFLRQLRARCDGTSRILIFDEVYTGCGRTGKWLACEHWDVTPDVVVIGKALSGSVPISACIGRIDVMSAWPASEGEAIHTSTFLGNPIACAAAVAQLDAIENIGLQRADELGTMITDWARDSGLTARGRGLIQGVVLENGRSALDVCHQCLQVGILLLAEGADSSILAITPPVVITTDQLRFALTQISAILSRVSP